MAISKLPYFSDYRTHPPNLGGKGDASYRPNVAEVARWGGVAIYVIKYFTAFFASKFFSYFPSVKTRCILWSEKYGIHCGP